MAALVDKKWAALGSSITIGAYYAPLLAGQTGMILTNLCVSGSALGLSTTGYPSYGMSNRIVDIPADTEIVTLEPGPNAFGAQETPLGAFGDTTYATHYGSLWAACVAIRFQAPSDKIVMIGTYSGGPSHATHRIGRINGQGNTMDQFFEAERYVAHALGIPFIDISQSGMGYLTSTLYMSDELHPHAAGSLRHATYDAECPRQMVRRGLFDA
ncbi:MAG: SGNH/GDSL hydrolase family protein [Mesorhizobium sp.]|nr:MAG: SGNH/GDSL hydrolase family protein [Mesorhizobium sp.]